MAREKKVKSDLLVIIAICSIALSLWGDTILTTSLADIYAAFPDASPFLQSYIVSGPSLLGIPLVLLIGAIGDKVNKKLLMLLSVAVYAIGGIGSIFSTNMTMFAIFRTIYGVATTGISVLAFSLIFALFPDQKKSARVVGIYQTFYTGYGFVFPIVIGQLCRISWKAGQLLHGCSLLTLLLVLLFMPNKTAGAQPGQEGEADASAEAPEGYREKTDVPRLVATLVEACIVYAFNFVYIYFVSVYVAERGIGDSGLAGVLASLLSLGGMIFNVFFSRIYEKMGRYIGVAFTFLCGVMYIILGFDIPVWLVIPVSLVTGLVPGAICSAYPMYCNYYAATNRATFCQSLYNCLLFAGNALVSFIPGVFMSVFHCGYHRMMTWLGITLLVIGTVFTILIRFWIAKPEKAHV